MPNHLKVIARKDRQTHRQYENITFPHTRAEMMATHDGQNMIAKAISQDYAD